MKTNQQFKNEALDALRGNWAKAVLLTLFYYLIVSAISGPYMYQTVQMQSYLQENAHSVFQMASLLQDPDYLALQQRSNGSSALMLLAEILLVFPLAVGICNAFRALLVREDNDLIPNAFRIAFNNYWHKVWGMLWMYILICLWTLLLIIPGIIKCFSYAMVPFILEENPELSASESIHRSRMMMRGHKYDLFWLLLGFLGWAILCLFTFGIGFLWLIPYIQTSYAAFYEEVNADYALNGGLD